MTVAEALSPAPRALPSAAEVGPLGRLGRWTAGHLRAVALAWAAVAVVLGAFAPRVEHALSGAGWEASGSDSVQARELIQENFAGLSSQALMVVVHSERQTLRRGESAVDRLHRNVDRTIMPPGGLLDHLSGPALALSQEGVRRRGISRLPLHVAG